MAELLDWGAANGVPTAGLKAVKDLVFVTLDGDLVHPGHVRISSDYMDTAGACIRNDQVMVPVRRLAELMECSGGAKYNFWANHRVPGR